MAPKAERRLAPARADPGGRGLRARPLLLDRGLPPAAPARATTPPPTPSSTLSPGPPRRRPAGAVSLGLGAMGARAPTAGADLARIGRSGVVELAPERGLELFDRGYSLPRTPLRSSPRRSTWRPCAGRRSRAPCPRCCADSCACPRAGRSPPARSSKRLGEVSPEERQSVLLELVRAHVAAVLGHASSRGDRPRRPLQGPRLRLARRGRAAQPPRARRAACACRRPSPSTTRPRVRWRVSFSASSILPRRRSATPIASSTRLPRSSTRCQLRRSAGRVPACAPCWRIAAAQTRAERDLDLDSAADDELLELIDAELGRR